MSINKEDTILSIISSQIQRILKTELHKPKQNQAAQAPVAEPVTVAEESAESAQELKDKNATNTNDDALSIAVALSLQNPNEIVTSPESESSTPLSSLSSDPSTSPSESPTSESSESPSPPLSSDPSTSPSSSESSTQELKDKNATNTNDDALASALSLQTPNGIVTSTPSSPESESSLPATPPSPETPLVQNTNTIIDDALSIAVALSLQNPDESELFDLNIDDESFSRRNSESPVLFPESDDNKQTDSRPASPINTTNTTNNTNENDNGGIIPGTGKNDITYTNTPSSSPPQKLQTNITNNTPINTLVENTAAAVSAKLSDTANNKEYGINSNNTQPNQPLNSNISPDTQIAATLSTSNNANTSATPPVQDNISIAASVAAAVSAESQSKQDNTNIAAADVSAESQSKQDNPNIAASIAAAVYDKTLESQHKQDNPNIAASIAAAVYDKTLESQPEQDTGIADSIAAAVSAKLSESQPNQENTSIATSIAAAVSAKLSESQSADTTTTTTATATATANTTAPTTTAVPTTANTKKRSNSLASKNTTILTGETTNDMVILYGDFVYKIDPKTPSQFIETTFDDNGDIQTRYLKLEQSDKLRVQVQEPPKLEWKSLDTNSEFYKKYPNITEEGIIAALQQFPQKPQVQSGEFGGTPQKNNNKNVQNDVIKVQNGENNTLIYGNLVYITPSSTDKEKWYSEFYTLDDGKPNTKIRKVRINEETNKLEFEETNKLEFNSKQKFDSTYYDNDEKITEDTIMQIIKH